MLPPPKKEENPDKKMLQYWLESLSNPFSPYKALLFAFLSSNGTLQQ
jgi:hypothetical protein